MTHRKSFSKKDRARLFSLYEGRCYLCEGKIDGVREAFEIEHVIPWALTQDDSDDNLRLAHVKCHKTKTHGPERAMLNKTERMRLKHLGMWPKAKGNARIKSRGFQSARGVIIPCACLLLLVPALLTGPLAIGIALDIRNMEPTDPQIWSAPR